MAIKGAARTIGPRRRIWLGAASALILGLSSGSASAQAASEFLLDGIARSLGDLVWIAVTAGTAVAAAIAFALLMRRNRSDRSASAEAEIASLRAALDRTAAL